MSVPSFNQWLVEAGHAPTGCWVLARRTPMMLARYPNSTFFTSKRLGKLKEEHRVLVRDALLRDIWLEGGAPDDVRDMLTEAFEAGRAAR